jgi:Glycosyl transferase family 2
VSTVSVIIPCYNYGQSLQESVNSVLTQEGPDVEVLIIDDASCDETPEVAARLSEMNQRVEFRRHQSNRGHIASYNEGLNWARGDYTVLLSADDMLADGALRRAALLMDAHPEVGLVYGRVLNFRSEPPRTHIQSFPVRYRIVSGQEWLRRRCRAGDTCISSPSAIVRTELQRELGGYREELPHSGDMEMWMRFALHASIGDIDAVQAYYRRHELSMQRQRFVSPLSRLQQRKAAFDAVFEEPSELPIERARLRGLVNHALARDALWSILQLVHRGEAQAPRVRALVRFAVDTHMRDGAVEGAAGTSLRARRAVSLAMLLGPILDGLWRWPRGWVDGHLEMWRGSDSRLLATVLRVWDRLR